MLLRDRGDRGQRGNGTIVGHSMGEGTVVMQGGGGTDRLWDSCGRDGWRDQGDEGTGKDKGC